MRVARRLLLGLGLACFLASSPVRAEPSPGSLVEALARSLVGRISDADSGTAVRPVAGEWTDAGVNQPVAAGMSVRTNGQGRARLRITADTLALAPSSELDLRQLADSGLQIVLRHGRIGVQLSELAPAHTIAIAVPRGEVWLLTPGDYDVAAGDAQMPGRVAVFNGHARFVGKGADTAIAAGQATTLSGGDPVVARRLDGAVGDDFVRWWRPTADLPAASASSNGDSTDSPTLRHISVETTGYDALDGNGNWQTVDGYGAVWFPATLPDNWAPYRFGHWRWIAPWGWTWIDDMSWGFAPSHYGRWARLAGPDGESERWGWVPGERVAHPAFMPAGVAFLGTAGVGLSFPDSTGPAIAWFPLAPDEVYWPSYTHDLDAIRQLNRSAISDVSQIGAGADGGPTAAILDGEYRNRRFASIVPRPIFVGGQPVAPALVQLPEQRLDNAPLLAGSPQIGPTAPHPAVAASTARPAKLTGAVRVLARIIGSQRRALALAPAAPAASAAAAAVATTHVQIRSGAHLVQLKVIHAVFSRSPHRPLQIAAIRRRH